MNTSFEKKELKKKSENISDWYNDVVLKAQLADYGPAKGTMIIRPYGYAIWERVQDILDGMFKKAGVQNAYFPLFIPYGLLAQEKKHVEGFSPELAIVTQGGGEELAEPLVVRPTSETIMYSMYAKWIESWRDLPMVINQWNNVVRWEKRTYLFLRTLEFLWQEGHGAHATHDESLNLVQNALNWYKTVYQEYYAIPVVTGRKSESERFAGAISTLCVEALMPDGKALQGATSHDLGQNFSKAQSINFQDKTGKQEFVWQNSWGFSTRTLGALFLVHGDDQGLVLPPKVAPYQVVIVPIFRKDGDSQKLLNYVEKLQKELEEKNIRVFADIADNQSPGRKFNTWEVRGVPVRLEIGMQEMELDEVTFARRDTSDPSTGSTSSLRASSGNKLKVKSEKFVQDISATLDDIQNQLFKKAQQFLSENTRDVGSYDEFKEIMNTKRGFLKAFWCEDAVCEAKIKEETKASTRCLPLDAQEEKGQCVYCGKEAKFKWYFAQAY